MAFHELHLMRSSAAVRLLKTVYEPPEKMTFILLADQLALRRCQLRTPDYAIIAEALVAEGIESDLAASSERAASGNLVRARHLATDKSLAKRLQVFAFIPSRLDGSCARVAALVDELFDHTKEAATPQFGAHADGLSNLEARVAFTGERLSGSKALQDHYYHQLRKFEAEELRSYLTTVAGAYRALVISLPTPSNADVCIQPIERIHKSIGVLGLNVNETLVLQALCLQCRSFMMHKNVRSHSFYTFQI